MSPRIGIFWIYKDVILGRSCPLSDGVENVPGLVDSPDFHVDLWENTPGFTTPFPELVGSEYQEVPRGRVLYSLEEDESIVYMDETLHSDKYKTMVSDFFDLDLCDIRWMTDPHYTTRGMHVPLCLCKYRCDEYRK